MNEELFWVVFNGPEPDLVRPLLAALRERPPAPAAERESFIEALMPLLARPEMPVPEAPVPAAPPSPPLPPPPPPPPLHTMPLPAMSPTARALPFVRPEDLPANKRSLRTMKSPVAKPVGSGTTPAGDDSIARAVAAIPFAGSKPPVVEVPRLELVTYASLCAELTVWPERAEEVRQRYQVPSPTVHEALDAQWRERAASDPGVRAELTRRYREYVGWLRGRRAAR